MALGLITAARLRNLACSPLALADKIPGIDIELHRRASLRIPVIPIGRRASERRRALPNAIVRSGFSAREPERGANPGLEDRVGFGAVGSRTSELKCPGEEPQERRRVRAADLPAQT